MHEIRAPRGDMWYFRTHWRPPPSLIDWNIENQAHDSATTNSTTNSTPTFVSRWIVDDWQARLSPPRQSISIPHADAHQQASLCLAPSLATCKPLAVHQQLVCPSSIQLRPYPSTRNHLTFRSQQYPPLVYSTSPSRLLKSNVGLSRWHLPYCKNREWPHSL